MHFLSHTSDMPSAQQPQLPSDGCEGQHRCGIFPSALQASLDGTALGGNDLFISFPSLFIHSKNIN